MPRRAPRQRASKPRPVDRREGKIKRWEKADDIPLDEEDQFHTSRDKILLEDDALGSDDGDEDEVFGLKGLSNSDEGDEAGGVAGGDFDMEDEASEEEPPPAPKSKSKSKRLKKTEEPPSSEEGDSSSEEETWGQTKAAYYASNADRLDSDDEEANELQEQEAKRLQAKAREEMAEDDFGLGDAARFTVDGGDAIDIAEPAPQVAVLSQDKKSIIRHLEKTNPETLALARDWEDTALNLVNTQEKMAQMDARDPDAISRGMAHLYYQALLTYTTTLAFYLYLRSSPEYALKPDRLKSHPVFSRLLTLKQSLSILEELDFALSDDGEDDDDDDDDIDMDGDRLWRLHKQIALEENELSELLGDAGLDAEWSTPESSPAPISNSNGPPKKKRKTSASTATPSEPTKEKVKFKLPAFDLVEPTFQPSKSKPKPKSTSHHTRGAADVFGEPTVLEHADAADKAARKRTLRFHTAKIESSRMRRQGARESAAGGDDDLPYRERERERKKGKDAKRGMGGEDLDDVEPVMEDHLVGDGGEDGHEDEEGADGYYELVQRRSREKKEKKKADYEEAQATARSVLDVDDVSTGPRSLTRAILANKGLTPRRAKSVRNPRVKKRERFEKAKRKVSSQKAIYKGGIGDVSKYAGEKSGISKVIKSVKLA